MSTAAAAPALSWRAAAAGSTQLAPSAKPAATPRLDLTTGWRWPLAPPHRVLRGFAVGPHRWSSGHRGVDLLGAAGASVLSPEAGTVRFVGVVAGRAVVSLAHDDGLISTFEPVVGSLPVGSPVRPGSVVGVLATTPGHCSRVPCLHWGVRSGSDYRDPLLLLGLPRRVILLPLGGPG